MTAGQFMKIYLTSRIAIDGSNVHDGAVGTS